MACTSGRSPVCLVIWSIWFVLLIWLIWFVWLVSFNQTNEKNQITPLTVFFTNLLGSHRCAISKDGAPRKD